jgi:hypothetical protein
MLNQNSPHLNWQRFIDKNASAPLVTLLALVPWLSMSSSVFKVKQGQSILPFPVFLVDENNVIAQIVSYIGKESLAKRPTRVTVAAVALAPMTCQQ